MSDEHHTMEELYDYRMAYNALLFNEWYTRDIYHVHKSIYHSDGELCFGGGWFIVVAETPFGQVSNHYDMKHWGLFKIRSTDTPDTYDGHTPQQALDRLIKTAAFIQPRR